MRSYKKSFRRSGRKSFRGGKKRGRGKRLGSYKMSRGGIRL